jgi:signal transduction histidine kinase/DNA-binding response OmpR family regulator
LISLLNTFKEILPGFSRGKTLEENILRHLFFIHTIVCLIYCAISLIIKDLGLYFYLTLSILLVDCLFYYLLIKNRYNLIVAPFIILVIIVLSVSWFLVEGSVGLVPPLFLISFIFYRFTLPKSHRILSYILLCVTFLVLLTVEWFYPDLILGYKDENIKNLNFTFALLATFFLCLMIIEITRKHYAAEREISEKQKEELQKATKAKSQFLANMSHEIRTPMNGVIGMTSLLNSTELSVEQKDYVDTIKLSGERLIGIVNEILDFSKIEAGEMKLEFISFSLRQCIEEVLEISAPKAFAKNLELSYFISDELLEKADSFFGDPAKLRQMLLNLVDNAVKFTKTGDIVISAESLEMLDDKSLVIRFGVRDSGIGISKENIGKLFREFTQVDVSTSRKYGGTGLGLSIVRALAIQMNGLVGIDSEEGKGSFIYFTIVAEIDNNAIPKEKYKQLKGMNFLVVEDNQNNIKLLKQFFDEWGVNFTLFETAESALDQIKTNIKFDLALIDYILPEMDGVELGLKLKALGMNFPMLILNSTFRQPDPALKNIFSCMTKPLRKQNLFNSILNACNLTERKVISNKTENKIPALTHSFSILIAEDDNINQKLVKKLFTKLGYQVDIAVNGNEAIKFALRKKYDIIFMDLQMPDTNGIEATIQIKEQLQNASPIIIAMTANAMEEDKKNCFEVGMNDFVTKPVTMEIISSVIVKWSDSILVPNNL